jgi:hypothetical protein
MTTTTEALAPVMKTCIRCGEEKTIESFAQQATSDGRNPDAVTADQVKGTIEKYYPRENLALVLVGCADSTATVAAKYGKVERKKISDPRF